MKSAINFSPNEKVAAVQAALEEKGLIPSNYFEEFSHTTSEEWVPQNGAHIVVRAWTDPEFRQRLLSDGRATVEAEGFPFPSHHKHFVALENTATVHNVIACTLCSCTAFSLIGIAPHWYKDFEYRSRIVRQARTVLGELGLDLPESVEIRVWDTTADTRYMVIPARPASTDDMTREQLMKLITKESLIGVERLEKEYLGSGNSSHAISGSTR